MGIEWTKVKNYCMKCRLYPSETQKIQIEALLRGAQAAYNMTLYKIGAEMRYTIEKPNKEGDGVVHFPDFNAAFTKVALDEIRHENMYVNYLPGEALSSIKYGLNADMKKSWEKTGKLPIEMWSKKFKRGPGFYNRMHPRTSFCYQTSAGNIHTTNNASVVKIKVGSRNYSVDGLIKARGVNQRIRFSDDLTKTFQDWLKDVSKVPMRIERELDQYFVVFMLKDAYKPRTIADERTKHAGLDVGEISLATMSDGKKYDSIFDANRYFDHNTRSLEELNRILSRKMGWKNIDFREARKKDLNLEPSKAYLEADRRYKQLSARRTNRKTTYYHMVTADICARYEAIAVEGLSVKDMFWYKEKNEDGEGEKENKQATCNP